MASATTLGVRDEFINTSDGWVGVVTIGPHGQQKGAAVEPRGSVWLTEDEQILTANAPRSDDDNPFINGMLELRTAGSHIKNRRPYGAPTKAAAVVVEEAQDAEETGATPVAAGEPELGHAAAGEEVATPAAVRKPSGRRKAT